MSEKIYLLCETNEECLNWWAHDINDELLFANIRKRARKSAFWRCPVCKTVFEKEVCYMVGPYGPVCPSCSAEDRAVKKMETLTLENTPVSNVPELISAWDDERDPSKVMVISRWISGSYDDRVFRFKCQYGHHAKSEPYTYLKRGCPFCNSQKYTSPGKGYIQDEWPELAAEWGIGNGKNTTTNTRHNSERKIHWKCLVCSYEWDETPRNRTRTYSACCPNCGKILGSLWWKYPTIAKEWASENELQSWQIRRRTSFTPKWICANDPNHQWETRIENRINGSGCPFCKDLGKSRTEIQFYEAAKSVFPTAESGVTITNSVFSNPWTVDIVVSTNDIKLAIEVDGLHWHLEKESQDTRKSLELLNEGFWVFRLRETGLPSLRINDPHYFEICVNPLTSRKESIFYSISDIINEYMQ